MIGTPPPKSAMNAVGKQPSKIGRPSGKEILERRANVLAVTRSIFIEYGYENTTIERVSERSGISKKSVYSWFENKSALMAEVITDIANGARAMLLKDAAIETGNVEEDLFRIGMSLLDIFCSNESLSITRFLSRESHKYPEFRNYVASLGLRDINGVLTSIFERHQDSIIDLGAPILARRFLSAITGDLSTIILYDRTMPGASEREAQAREVSRLFVHGILK